VPSERASARITRVPARRRRRRGELRQHIVVSATSLWPAKSWAGCLRLVVVGLTATDGPSRARSSVVGKSGSGWDVYVR
jgi:hypothetical protein